MKQDQISDGCFSVLMVLLSFMYGFYNYCDVPSCKELYMWVSVETGYYVFNIFFVYCYYQAIKRNNRDNVKFFIFNCVLNLIHSIWLIYGNAIYYPNKAECSENFNSWKNVNNNTSAQNVTWIMLA